MNIDKRQVFLEHFLKLFEVDRVEITNAEIDKIFGHALYLKDDDKQEFCWHMTEQNAPTDDIIHLIAVIKDNKYNRTDKIIVSADTVFEKTGWSDRVKFNIHYEKLFDIEVKMIDDGKETDSYFIHD
jgi:hypothetical protein